MGNYCNNRSAYARGGRYVGRRYNGCSSCDTAQPMSVTDCGCEARVRNTDCGCEARMRDADCGCETRMRDADCGCEARVRNTAGGCENAAVFTNCPDQVLAMAYVPFQRFGDVYEVERGFIAGTLFAELDKPFKGGRCV